jgi:hypothetical protein
MIEDWVCKKGWCDGSRDGEINNILAALDHFAPPIVGMSVEEIEAAMDRAMQGVFIGSQLAPNGMAYNLSHARRRYAEEIHRLAQPARVDVVDPIERACLAFYGHEQWERMGTGLGNLDNLRDAMKRAVAAAKEAGDA